MKKLIIYLFCLFPVIGNAQQHVTKKKDLFHPYISLNYNWQNIPFHTFADNELITENSNFFGAEFGFTIFPKNQTGLFFEYNNKLLPELGIREIYNLIDNGSGNKIVDYTLSSGFFGSLDIGKEVKSFGNSQFIVGIRVADKWVSGVLHNAGPIPLIETDGFHFAPGINGKYKNKLSTNFSLCVKLAISQSVLNFWQFADNADDFDFKYPLFTDLSIKLLHKSGLYLKLENNLMISYSDIQPVYRNSVAIGYRF